MPRNGAGVFSLVNNTWFPPVTGVLATSTDWSTFIIDIQNAITQSVSSDGQTPFTGNLPMGNNKITGLANATAATDAAAYGQVVKAIGQCILLKVAGNLVLLPGGGGNQVTINNSLQIVPSGGVTLAPGAVTPATLYYIYVFMSGTTMTLEASTTAPTTDVSTGVRIKTGDVTRSLVGMARPIAGPLWQDTSNQRFVVSWFNKRQIPVSAAFTTGRSTSSASYTEPNSEIRNEFLGWAGDGFTSKATGDMSNTATNSQMRTAIGFDSTTVAQDGNGGTTIPTAGQIANVDAYLSSTIPSDGYHFTTLLGAVVSGGGTTTYVGSGVPGTRTTLQSTFSG